MGAVLLAMLACGGVWVVEGHGNQIGARAGWEVLMERIVSEGRRALLRRCLLMAGCPVCTTAPPGLLHSWHTGKAAHSAGACLSWQAYCFQTRVSALLQSKVHSSEPASGLWADHLADGLPCESPRAHAHATAMQKGTGASGVSDRGWVLAFGAALHSVAATMAVGARRAAPRHAACSPLGA